MSVVEPLPDGNFAQGTDWAMAIARGLVGSIPVVGNVSAEVFGQLDPMKERRERWEREVTTGLNQIAERLNGLPAEIVKSKAFLSFFIAASIIAFKNHREEKLRALRNALVATATDKANDEDSAFQFLYLIDQLTVTHLEILNCLFFKEGEIAGIVKMEELLSKVVAILGHGFERGLFRACIADLDRAFLVRSVDLEEFPEDKAGQSFLMTEESARSGLWLTERGKQFLSFISTQPAK